MSKPKPTRWKNISREVSISVCTRNYGVPKIRQPKIGKMMEFPKYISPFAVIAKIVKRKRKSPDTLSFFWKSFANSVLSSQFRFQKITKSSSRRDGTNLSVTLGSMFARLFPFCYFVPRLNVHLPSAQDGDQREPSNRLFIKPGTPS